MTRKCPDCGYRNHGAVQQFCHHCGAILVEQNSANLETQPSLPAIPQSPAAIPSSDTRPLANVSTVFAPLPEGALLYHGLYVILELRNTNEHSNTYLALTGFPPMRS